MSVSKNEKTCCSCIPKRLVFIFLSFLGFSIFYTYKVALSVAIVSMVGHDNLTADSGQECHLEDGSHENSYIKGEFKWDAHKQASILGAFFYGYAITQVPAGLLSEKFGAKWVYGISLLTTAILSIVSPFAARWSFASFFTTRFLQGMACGVSYPCMSAMIARWMPKMERSRAVTIVFTGSNIGTIITLPLAGYLCAGTFMDGWPAIFYILGIAGCVWFVFWALFVYETPDIHPHITQKEYDYIIINQGKEKANKSPPLPWKSIFTSLPVYALIIKHFAQNWGYFTVLTLLPTYFTKILHFDIQKNGLMSSLPYLMNVLVGYLSSLISDKVRSSGKVPVNWIRKINSTIAYLGPALCMIGVILVKCDSTLTITFFALGLGLLGCCFSGLNSTHVDMAPDFAGTLMGITNTFGTFPGFLAPIVAAQITSEEQTLINWSYVFYLSAGFNVLAVLVYGLFASSDLQEWGVSRKLDQFNENIL